jgi:uncharacterized membrane protein YhaH (DUF805 family)
MAARNFFGGDGRNKRQNFCLGFPVGMVAMTVSNETQFAMFESLAPTGVISSPILILQIIFIFFFAVLPIWWGSPCRALN